MTKFRQKSILIVTTLLFTSNFAFADECIKPNTTKNYDKVDCLYEQLAKVELNGKSGFIDKDGKEIIPLQYKSASNFYQGIALVELNDKIEKEYDYSYFRLMAPPLARRKDVNSNRHINEYIGENLSKINNYRFIDKTGTEIIPLTYDSVDNFKNCFTRAEFQNKCIAIDTQGKKVNK